MRLFSLFKKTAAPPAPATPASSGAAGFSVAEPTIAGNAETSAARLDTQALQRDIARATAMKIDAIESAMTFDIFNTPEPAWGSRPPRRPAPPAAPGATPAQPELPSTELLLDEDGPEQPVAAESAPVAEESAMLYANGQLAAAEQLLRASLPAGKGQERTLWWMLFDLYQIGRQQEQFDNLSIDYASSFETSPPDWAPPLQEQGNWSGVTPGEVFIGKLDQHIAPQLARLLELSHTSPLLRLDFSRIDSVTAPGCALLLRTLRALQARQRELIVVDAAGLAALLRAGICVGRRDDSEVPWLLLLEMLQLLGREKDFEETAMDYCVTFEVSPPSYVAPRQPAAPRPPAPARWPDRFLLPATIAGDCAALLAAIAAYGERESTLVFDCSRLNRIECGAASELLAALQKLASAGKQLELRDLNHLVAVLLRMLGYADIAKIYPHKY